MSKRISPVHPALVPGGALVNINRTAAEKTPVFQRFNDRFGQTPLNGRPLFRQQLTRKHLGSPDAIIDAASRFTFQIAGAVPSMIASRWLLRHQIVHRRERVLESRGL